MITQSVLTIRTSPEHVLYTDSAYRLYAYLLELLPPEGASWLHETGSKCLSQSLRYEKNQDAYLWTVNMLSERATKLLAPVLADVQKVFIENQEFDILHRQVQQTTMEALLSQGVNSNRATLNFITPTAFKQNGRYTIFPQERLLLQSLINRWNEIFTTCPIEDEDVFAALLAGIHIVDYRLQTSRFLLKSVRIPGFSGSCVLSARLAPPLLELWNTLLSFAHYAGMGIKTSLGMGGTRTMFHEIGKQMEKR